MTDYNYESNKDFLHVLEAIKGELEERSNYEYLFNLTGELCEFVKIRDFTCYIGSPYSNEKNRVLDLVDRIGTFIETIGIKPYIPHLHTQDPDKDIIPDDAVARLDFNGVKSSVFTIFEITNPSHGVGMEMYCSYINDIPYIALKRKHEGVRISKLVHGTMKKEHLIEYYFDEYLFDELYKRMVSILIAKVSEEM